MKLFLILYGRHEDQPLEFAFSIEGCYVPPNFRKGVKVYAVALLLFFGASLSFANDDNLQKVNHIIIVMQENHSFDNYFGVLAYATESPYHNGNGGNCPAGDNQCVDGLTCSFDSSGDLDWLNSNLDDNGSKIVAFHEPSRCVAPDLDHSWFGTHREANFLNPNSALTNFLADGFVRVNDSTEQIKQF